MGAAETSPEPDEQQVPSARVSRTITAPIAQVWDRILSPAGARALLGPGARFAGKGEPWRSKDGPSGVLRSFHPQEQLRWSWHETPDAPATLVELDLQPEDAGTRLDLQHHGVEDRSAYEARWAAALDRLGAMA